MVPKSSEKRVGLDIASLQFIFPRVINQLANEWDYVTLNAAALTCRALRDVFLPPLAVLLPQLHIATDALESTVGLEAAMEECHAAFEALNSRAMAELRAFARPPVGVNELLGLVFALISGSELRGRHAKTRQEDIMRGPRGGTLLNALATFEPMGVTARQLSAVQHGVSADWFDEEHMRRISTAAAVLVRWVRGAVAAVQRVKENPQVRPSP